LLIVTIFNIEYDLMFGWGLGEKEKRRKGEKEKGEKGEGAKGRKGERAKGRKGAEK
jgi:hypothetical protein